jgi:hypothetical protein
MKYMLMSAMSDTFTTITSEERIKVINGSSAFYQKYRKNGTLKEIYLIPSVKKHVSIWEVKTPEDIDKLFMENPASPYENAELYLLADWDAHEKAAKELFG